VKFKLWLWSLSCCLLASAQEFPLAAHAASPKENLKQLEHMDYFSARQKILAEGWKPVHGACRKFHEETCTRFPEIRICSDVDPGYCGMFFAKKNQCLNVITSGGEPWGATYGDTHVKEIVLRRGPCWDPTHK
jgi:hypothetical protein